MSASKESVIIKKYANRRLYNTSTSTYVTLENLSEMVKAGTEFNVYDAKSNEDITRGVLTQIIVEEEGKTGQNLLPVSFMRNLIGFYGNNMQWLVPKYLEHSLQSLTKNQEQIREYYQKTFGSLFPFGNTLEEMSKQNMAMFERTMRMFSPFGTMGGKGDLNAALSVAHKAEPRPVAKKEEAPSACAVTPRPAKKLVAVPTPETSKAAHKSVSGEDVQNKIAALQRQLSELAKHKA